MSRHDIYVVQVRAAIRLTQEPAFGAGPVDAVAREIGSLGIPGQVIDGADLGIPGWIIARMIGDVDGQTILHFNAEVAEPEFGVSWRHLQSHLQSVFGVDVQVSDEIAVDGHVVLQDGLFALGPDYAAALVVPTGDHLYEAVAAGLGTSIRRFSSGGYDVIERVERPSDEDLIGDLFGDLGAVSNAVGRKRSALLWRRGAVSGLALIRKDGITAEKVWEPEWKAIVPAGAESDEDLRLWGAEVAEDLVDEEPDVSHFVDQFGLDNEAAVLLRALFRRREVDFAELVKILGLPAEAGQILTGDPALDDRPGFEVIEPMPVRELLRAEFNRAPEGSGLLARFQRAAVAGAPWYVAANLIFLVACALLVVDTFRGGTALWMGLLAGVFGTLTVVEHVVRRRARKARIDVGA